jgi:histidinol-phosphate/aromatic aminotransferase/cobyric acid decarboxylase-like protein
MQWLDMEDNRNPWRTSYVICTLFTAVGDTNYKMENQVREYVQEREKGVRAVVMDG